ncbi:PLP-dependent aminotransferase family protein [Actinomadura sp. BRA 177]|uniref:aminotransferase-like domain-containing protein n=1 Tax=Actinomadura sp. BRA 177 TaxID=2745202 RepID=UPI0015954AEA|nr:PLP-dependent aminotransferase family protein [Actinomadura sp. BRA 177]NVI88845.1 PLP-dependent aminotransferase family protein [Actinomadura sp. BRA 177]
MPKDWAGSVDLHLHVDIAAGRRAGLERALRAAIADGRLAPGTALPSTRALSAELGFARGTVTAAYDQLIAEGRLVARPGSRTRVARFTAATPAATAPPPAETWTEVPGAPAHDMRPGRPDLSRFSSAAWGRSTRRVLSTAAAEVHALGDPRGRPELRAALAGYLGRARGVHADPARIVITSGYAQALGLLAAVLPGPFAMEEPGHFLHRAIVERAGAEIIPLPVDDLGADPGLLGEAGTAVLTPAHQYPSGATLHPDRRRAFTAWARDTGGILIEDDYDGEFRYDRQPVGAVQAVPARR